LYKRVFTAAGTAKGIRAAFFITEDDRAREGKRVRKGAVIHVAGLVDEGVILNAAVPGARLRALEDMRRWFAKDDCRTELRGLDAAALARLSRENVRYGLDKEMTDYFSGG
jgi:hypothetical protein